MTSMGRGHALYGTDHWSDGAWTVKAHGSIGAPAGASARAGRGCTASCTARATVHRWAARAGLLGVPSQAPHICEVVQSSEEKGAGVRSQWQRMCHGRRLKGKRGQGLCRGGCGPTADPGTKGRRATAGRAHPWSGTALTPRRRSAHMLFPLGHHHNRLGTARQGGGTPGGPAMLGLVPWSRCDRRPKSGGGRERVGGETARRCA